MRTCRRDGVQEEVCQRTYQPQPLTQAGWVEDDWLVPALTVEVFPIEPTRWIAVVDATKGPFSTEVASPQLVGAEVARAILEVRGDDLPHELVDESGRPGMPRSLGARWVVCSHARADPPGL